MQLVSACTHTLFCVRAISLGAQELELRLTNKRATSLPEDSETEYRQNCYRLTRIIAVQCACWFSSIKCPYTGNNFPTIQQFNTTNMEPRLHFSTLISYDILCDIMILWDQIKYINCIQEIGFISLSKLNTRIIKGVEHINWWVIFLTIPSLYIVAILGILFCFMNQLVVSSIFCTLLNWRKLWGLYLSLAITNALGRINFFAGG